MRIAVVGGALQGLEVVYLARKAGIEVLLIDRRARVPAMDLCDAFRQIDVNDGDVLDRELSDVDLVFPALESPTALDRLHDWAHRRQLPMVHDPRAYAISSSKIASERFFQRHAIPVPATWPDCRFPAIAKPAYGSGSQGIRTFGSPAEVRSALGDDPASRGWIVQAFIDGPIHSVEVIRYRGQATAIQITDLHMDERFDCKRVTAPTVLSAALQEELTGLCLKIADEIRLEGIMDVEAIPYGGEFKVLEIDARFPSQTPIAVFGSCGVNMVEVLARCALNDGIQALPRPPAPARGSVLEHVSLAPGTMTVAGEHLMAAANALKVNTDFFGADEAITDYAGGKDRWVATLLCTGKDLAAAWERRSDTVTNIRRRFRIDRYRDPSPPTPTGGP